MEYRSFTPDLEVRAGGDGRTIHGIAVPYGIPMVITESLTEQFARSSFNAQLRAANRVKVSAEHLIHGGTLIGALALMRDDAAGLYFEGRVSKTPKGDETLELVKDGALHQVSIGFDPVQDRQLRGGIVERVRARLFELAIVLEGAYGDYAVAQGVRSANPATRSYAGIPVQRTPGLDELAAILAAHPPLIGSDS